MKHLYSNIRNNIFIFSVIYLFTLSIYALTPNLVLQEDTSGSKRYIQLDITHLETLDSKLWRMLKRPEQYDSFAGPGAGRTTTKSLSSSFENIQLYVSRYIGMSDLYRSTAFLNLAISNKKKVDSDKMDSSWQWNTWILHGSDAEYFYSSLSTDNEEGSKITNEKILSFGFKENIKRNIHDIPAYQMLRIRRMNSALEEDPQYAAYFSISCNKERFNNNSDNIFPNENYYKCSFDLVSTIGTKEDNNNVDNSLEESSVIKNDFSATSSSESNCSGECWIQNYIEPSEDFPIPGVSFQWYRKLLEDPMAFNKVIDKMAEFITKNKITTIAALDSRGFFFAGALSYKLNLPLILIRKEGKLPPPVLREAFSLEYASAAFEIEEKAKVSGEKVVIIDDVIATGGTMIAATKLLKQSGVKELMALALLDLPEHKGKKIIENDHNVPVFSLLSIR